MANTLHIISGVTAVGKTNFALDYAEEHDAEIISCDASLVYRGMDIGTAKPTAQELARIPHHLIDVQSVDQPFDITRYDQMAREAVECILDRGKSVVVTGGSGFYLKSFFEPVVDSVEVSAEIRARSDALFVKRGLEGLLEALEQVSPEGFGSLDQLNPRRVQRALERCWASGKPLPLLQAEFAQRPKPYSSMQKVFILLERSSEALSERLTMRAEAMLEAGLIKEVSHLKTLGIEKNPNAANAIGYRETLAYLQGTLEKGDLLGTIIKNTKALVKKQKTWFRSQLPQADHSLDLDSVASFD